MFFHPSINLGIQLHNFIKQEFQKLAKATTISLALI